MAHFTERDGAVLRIGMVLLHKATDGFDPCLKGRYGADKIEIHKTEIVDFDVLIKL
jgi:hypothetical protein